MVGTLAREGKSGVGDCWDVELSDDEPSLDELDDVSEDDPEESEELPEPEIDDVDVVEDVPVEFETILIVGAVAAEITLVICGEVISAESPVGMVNT